MSKTNDLPVQKQEKEYISATETAKLVRRALKKHFPNTKFYVRTDKASMSATINIYWQDGPTVRDVEKVTEVYAGEGFDGMIDMRFGHFAWLLPDGSATPAYSHGTVGSRGTYEPYEYPKPHPDAKLVHFMADFVHVNRSYTEKTCKQVNDALIAAGYPEMKIDTHDWWVGGKVAGKCASLYHYSYEFQRVCRKALNETSFIESED